MQIKELRDKNSQELEKLLISKRNEWRDLKFKSAAGQLKNFQVLNFLRKDIARIKFLLAQKKEDAVKKPVNK